MTPTEQVRLYLRDQISEGVDNRFSDEDIAELIKLNNDSVYGATALGWLLKAADTPEGAISMSIGNTSESYGGPTEQYKVCMSMHTYWKGKYQEEQGNDFAVGLWMELVPDYAEGTGGVVAELMQHDQWLRDYWTNTAAYPA
jgi:hypothetical protein